MACPLLALFQHRHNLWSNWRWPDGMILDLTHVLPGKNVLGHVLGVRSTISDSSNGGQGVSPVGGAMSASALLGFRRICVKSAIALLSTSTW